MILMFCVTLRFNTRATKFMSESRSLPTVGLDRNRYAFVNRNSTRCLSNRGLTITSQYYKLLEPARYVINKKLFRLCCAIVS